MSLRSWLRSLLTSLGLILFVATSFGIKGVAGPYRVELTSEPDVVPVGRATLDIALTDSSGNPVSGARIRGIAQMPGMPMGEREQLAAPGTGRGHYTMPAVFAMAGGYEAKLSISGPLGSATAVIPIETGRATASPESSTFPWTTFLLVAATLVVLALVLLRMRATSQSVALSRILTGSTLLVTGVLAAAVAVAVFTVNHFRPAGAMTPIEAQTMSMSMPAPPGSAPVTLATAEIREFDPGVRYSGQAVGFVEQDVVARTSGTIVSIRVYVGDSVRKGQVLAQLDTSQLGPQLAEQEAMLRNAVEGIAVAQRERDQALAMVHQADAEVGEYSGAVDEAVADLEAAKQGRLAAESQVRSARADADDARSRLQSAEADQQYWAAEIKRETALFQASAVSRDEFEKERAEAGKAVAAVGSAEEVVGSANAKVAAARAEAAKAGADVSAAARKVDESRSMLMSHHAHVASAESEAAAAGEKVSQAVSAASQARASYQAASAGRAYATITAEADGIVADRLISPGVLVYPGQAILRVDQVSPIRIQANVAGEDLARIRPGAKVLVLHRGATEAPVEARVSSVSPALDPVSRTGIVEAVLPNRNKAFLPGQFVTMDISTGLARARLVIPERAALAEVLSGSIVPDATRSYVWVADPVAGQGGNYTVRKRPVSLGDGARAGVAVLSGLKPGDHVVVIGAQGLQDGQSVTDVSAPTAPTKPIPGMSGMPGMKGSERAR